MAVLRVFIKYSREQALEAVEPGVNFLNDTFGDGLGGETWDWLAQQASEHPLSPVKPLANNPITRITSDMTFQSVGQNIRQNPLIQQTKNIVTGATPLFNGQASAASGGTGKPASQMVNGANVANGHATVLNQQQATPNAPNSNGTGNNDTNQRWRWRTIGRQQQRL